MTTYTYPVGTGCEPHGGMTAEDVAVERLTHDGAEYWFRAEGDGWAIYVRESAAGRRQVIAWDGPSPYGRTLRSDIAKRGLAWQALCERVVGAEWRGVPPAMTDADYAAMLAEVD